MQNGRANMIIRVLAITALLGLAGCSDPPKKSLPTSHVSANSRQKTAAARDAGACPATAVHIGAFPEVRKKHQTAAYWLGRWRDAELDSPLMTADEIARHNRAVGHSGRTPMSQWNLSTPMSSKELEAELGNRLHAIGTAVKSGAFVASTGKPVPPPQLRFMDRASGTLRSPGQPPLWYVALDRIPMRCAPYNGPLFKSDSDMAFDKNACSAISPQEPFELLGLWKNDLLFVRTRYAFGFIPRGSPHSPNVPEPYRRTYMDGQTVWTTADIELTCDPVSDSSAVTKKPKAIVNGAKQIEIPAHTMLPTQRNGRLLIAHERAFCSAAIPEQTVPTSRPLTRRAFYQTTFAYLGAQYGFGGSESGMDCSRFVMNVMATFGLALPRNSKHQAQSGPFAIDVSKITDLKQKLKYLRLANHQGITAIYFPGHIMLYLGETEAGVPMAIHALGEYAKPCDATAASNNETIFRVKKVVVTDLSPGLGSSRRSFLERMTRIVVFGADPGKALRPLVTHRPAETPVLPEENCDDSVSLRIFQSPRRLITDEPARLIATGRSYHPRTTLQIYSPQGEPIPRSVQELGGPPYTWWVDFTPAATGTYTAVLGDGDRILACDQFSVRTYRSKKKPRIAPEPWWQTRWKWEPDTENFYSAFVEQLFNFPKDADVSWNGLQALLKDPKQNLLFNHLGQNEDAELNLNPDCADLPYVLRAYFSWKTSLPFGIRSCSRGRKGRPPSCSEFQTNAEEAPLEETLDSEAKIFERFANVVVGWNAHSASGRTHPKSNDTDFYPVALNRDALPPGTVFTDPYGHVMIVSKWYDQPLGGYGILMAVDGQPDGTIGRRRFWRGDFLFDADTESYGAGFKRFRPIVMERENTEEGTIQIPKTLENRELLKSRQFTAYSLEQYELGTDGFYTRMQRLINPTPLNAEKLLQSRIDALFEAVKRRVQAVENGDVYLATQDYPTIEMPEGHALFQTEGPWEDYSTPSRDMRLLIAIDAVMTTPEAVAKSPKQYGISGSSEINRVISRLREFLETQLQQKQIQYRRSDGSQWRLSLAAIVSRAPYLEMAYNPNDCPEIRWGGQKGSTEYATCNRHAPEEQRHRMQQYRRWFKSRKRPVRE